GAATCNNSERNDAPSPLCCRDVAFKEACPTKELIQYVSSSVLCITILLERLSFFGNSVLNSFPIQVPVAPLTSNFIRPLKNDPFCSYAHTIKIMLSGFC